MASVTQNGRVCKIKVYQGSGQQLTQAHVGQQMMFNLKSRQSPNGNIYVSGFWNDRAQVNQQPPQQPQNPQSYKPESASGVTQREILETLKRIEKLARGHFKNPEDDVPWLDDH